MSTAAVYPRVTLTIEISGVLFDVLQVTAAMSQTTVPAFIGSTLRQTQVTFFAELSDVELVDVAEAPILPSPGEGKGSRPRRRRDIGPLQAAILDQLASASTGELGVYDLRQVRLTMLRHHRPPSISRAVRQFVRRGALVPTGTGVRYVRRGAGN